jgi:hypothetical protein
MIVETGHFALILALAAALVQMALPAWGARQRDERLMAVAGPAALVQLCLVLAAFLALMHAYVTSDFSVETVWANSHTAKPLIYKISGVWGNHEGSMLLWVLILAVFGAAVLFFGTTRHAARQRAGRAGRHRRGFPVLIILASNPSCASRRSRRAAVSILSCRIPRSPHRPSCTPAMSAFDRLLLCHRRADRGTHGCRLGAGAAVTPPPDVPDARHAMAPWAYGELGWAAGGSGTRSRTPRSCHGSPRQRCCTRRW